MWTLTAPLQLTDNIHTMIPQSIPTPHSRTESGPSLAIVRHSPLNYEMKYKKSKVCVSIFYVSQINFIPAVQI